MAPHSTIALPKPSTTDGASIVFDRVTKDYCCFVDGQYIGHEATYQEATYRTHEVIIEQLRHTQVETADLESEYGTLDTVVEISIDCLIAAHEQQPDTKAQQNAWGWLVTVESVTMRGTAYIIPSAKWSDTTYTTTATSCTCPARKPCWHMMAAQTLDIARENAAIDLASGFSQDYIDACYEEFEPVYLAGIAAVATPTSTAQPTINYRAALASGISDLWA